MRRNKNETERYVVVKRFYPSFEFKYKMPAQAIHGRKVASFPTRTQALNFVAECNDYGGKRSRVHYFVVPHAKKNK